MLLVRTEKDLPGQNGSHEIRIDEVSMTNLGLETSVNDVFASNFNLYPNPVQDLINIESSTAIDKAEILNFAGKTIVSSNNLNNNTIDVFVCTKWNICFKGSK